MGEVKEGFNNGLEGKKEICPKNVVSTELGEALLGLHRSLESHISDIREEISRIDNEIIRNNISYFWENGTYGMKRIQKEINIYNEIIKPKLSDEGLNKLFNLLLSNKRMKVMPSYLSRQFDIYEELKSARGRTEKKIISRYLEEGFPPSLVYEEYDIYRDIKAHEFKSKRVKKYVLSLMKKGIRPNNMDVILSLTGNMTECKKKTKQYIKDLLNSPVVAY